MKLENKIAVIYGATGAVGSAVASRFAEEGAVSILVARDERRLKLLAEKISSAGGRADYHSLDVLDQPTVEAHLAGVKQKYGRIDISFNLVAISDVQGKLLTEMRVEDFLLPIQTAMKAQFITATAAAKLMDQRSGVVLMLTAQAGKLPYLNTGGFGIACAAMEALIRQLALELGGKNIRAVCLRSAGSPDAKGVDEVFKLHAQNQGITREDFEERFAQRTMLKRLPVLREVANTAVMLASDEASAITSAIINLTCGELSD